MNPHLKKNPDVAIPDAAIMAAGRGNRLMPLTADRPKCLLEVGGAAILLHQVRACAACGVPRIQVVTGHGAALVRALFPSGKVEAGGCPSSGAPVDFAHNADYDATNSLFSLGCATLDADPACAAARGMLILNSDVLFHPDQLRALLADPRENVLLAAFGGTLGDEEMKIRITTESGGIAESGRIAEIGKRIAPESAHAENLGVLKVGPAAAACMLALARQAGEIHGHSWIPDAINSLLGEMDFYALPAERWPWIEIDYPHDLERARIEVWPRIAPAMAALHGATDA